MAQAKSTDLISYTILLRPEIATLLEVLVQQQKEMLRLYDIEADVSTGSVITAGLKLLAGKRDERRPNESQSPSLAVTVARPSPSPTVAKPVTNKPIAEPPKQAVASKRDPRLPPVGTKLRCKYQGKGHEVTIEAGGFRHQGVLHTSLSAVAKAIVGYGVSPYQLFGIDRKASPTQTPSESRLEKRPSAKPPAQKAPGQWDVKARQALEAAGVEIKDFTEDECDELRVRIREAQNAQKLRLLDLAKAAHVFMPALAAFLKGGSLSPAHIVLIHRVLTERGA